MEIHGPVCCSALRDCRSWFRGLPARGGLLNHIIPRGNISFQKTYQALHLFEASVMTPGPQITTFNEFSLFISGKHVPLITTNYPTPGIKHTSLTTLICCLSGRIFWVHKVTASTRLAVCTIPGVAETASSPPGSILSFFCISKWAHGCLEQLPYLPGN